MADGEEHMAVTLRRRRFTVDEYHRMGEAGIFHEDDRVELIEGEIVEMTPIARHHASVVARINQFFSIRLGRGTVVWPQNPLLLAALISEPQPDLILLAPRPDFYARALPQPADVQLVIEVADSSLAYDRRTKIPLYARAGIAETWLVNVEANRVELYRRPDAAGYVEVRSPTRDERFSPLAFPDLLVTPADLLG